MWKATGSRQAVVLFWRLRIKRTVRTLNAVLGNLASVGQWQQALPFLELRTVSLEQFAPI